MKTPTPSTVLKEAQKDLLSKLRLENWCDCDSCEDARAFVTKFVYHLASVVSEAMVVEEDRDGCSWNHARAEQLRLRELLLSGKKNKND